MIYEEIAFTRRQSSLTSRRVKATVDDGDEIISLEYTEESKQRNDMMFHW